MIIGPPRLREAGLATNTPPPGPGRASTSPRASSSLIASLTVATATPNRSRRSSLVPSRSPVLRTPAAISSSISRASASARDSRELCRTGRISADIVIMIIAIAEAAVRHVTPVTPEATSTPVGGAMRLRDVPDGGGSGPANPSPGRRSRQPHLPQEPQWRRAGGPAGRAERWAGAPAEAGKGRCRSGGGSGERPVPDQQGELAEAGAGGFGHAA